MLTVDASVLVAAVLDDEEAHRDAVRLLDLVTGSGRTMHEPAIAVVEVVSAIVRRTGDSALAQRTGRYLLRNPTVMLHPLDMRATSHAAGLAADRRLRAGDAFYAAVAQQNDCQLITLDAELIGRARPEIDALTPAEWLAQAGAEGR